MKIIDTIKGVALGAILFGVFANFARNAYGITIIWLALFILTMLYVISIRVTMKNKLTNEYPVLESIGLSFLSLAILFKMNYYPGASVLIGVATLLLSIYLAVLIIRILINKTDNISIRIQQALFYLSIFIGLVFFIFYIQHWDGQFIILNIHLILTTVVLGFLFFNFILKKEFQIKQKIMKNMKILFFIFYFISIYAVLSVVHLQPHFFSDSTPETYQKLRNEAVISQKKELMEKSQFYIEAYYNFLNNRKKTNEK